MFHLRSQLVQTECIGERLTGRVKNKRDLSVSQWKPEFKIFTFIAPSFFSKPLTISGTDCSSPAFLLLASTLFQGSSTTLSCTPWENFAGVHHPHFLMRSSKTCWKYLWRLLWSCQSQGQQDAPWIPCQWSLCLAWSPCNQLYWTFSLQNYLMDTFGTEWSQAWCSQCSLDSHGFHHCQGHSRCWRYCIC